MEQQENKNFEIESLRGIAILFVFICHIPGMIPWHSARIDSYAHGLWVGVDLFFVISGFVITQSISKTLQNSTGERFWRLTIAFWIKRAWRILPTAWLWLALPLAITFAANGMTPPPNYAGNLADALSAVLQVSNFHFYQCTIDKELPCGGFGVYWSLSLEEQFYILLPLIILFARKKLILVMALIAVTQLLLPRSHWAGLASFIRTDAIALGVCIALLAQSKYYKLFKPKFLDKNQPRIFTFILLTAIAMATRLQIVSFYLGLTSLLCAVTVWIASYNSNYLFRNGSIKIILGWIGSRSFAIYLCHVPISWFVNMYWQKHAPDTGFNGSYFLRFMIPILVCSLIAAELNYRFFETPLRQKGRVLADRFVNNESNEID